MRTLAKNLLVPVAVAARLLSASEGTVATWLDDGLLREWDRGPKRRIVDAREALLLCGIRHDLQQVSAEVADALELDRTGSQDTGKAPALAIAYAEPTGILARKLEASITRYLTYGYSEAEIKGCLQRLVDYRSRHRNAAVPAASGNQVAAAALAGDHQYRRMQVHRGAAVRRYDDDPLTGSQPGS